MTAASQSTTAGPDSAIYLYGIAESDAAATAARPLIEGVVPGRAVELLPFGKFTVVMSRGAQEAFLPPDTMGDRADDWVVERALAHHRVLTALAERCTVAPVKYGALCRSMDDVVALLGQQAHMFERALGRVAGAREWGIKLFANVEFWRAAAENGGTAGAIKAESMTASPGKAFFLRKKYRAAVEQALRSQLDGWAESVHLRVAAAAREASRNAGHQRYGGSQKGDASIEVLRAAYLVDRSREEAFLQEVSSTAAATAGQGGTLKLTGPWPPYSFTSIDTGRADDDPG
jgi:hypothetical protein